MSGRTDGGIGLRVFIAGTGRSGTTILHDLIGHHPDIHAIPDETKFLVEADGLNALIPALTDRFSVTASDLALQRFMLLMGVDWPGAGATAEDLEFGRGLRDLIGADRYDAALGAFLQAITEFTYLGAPFPRHFEDRARLIALARDMVEAMFGGAAQGAGKAAWVEKTPSNLIALDLLWEMFPEARILHVKRDPRGVLHSLVQQDWAPQEIGAAASYLRHIYWRWGQLKPRLDLPASRYMELRLEDLCTRPEEVLAGVTTFLGLASPISGSRVNPALASRWRHEMPDDQRRFAEARLGDMFPLMGYEI